MTIEEHREEAQRMAKAMENEPWYRIDYDREAIVLIAFAIEQDDPGLLDAIEDDVQEWIEGLDEKSSRSYFIEVARNVLQK